MNDCASEFLQLALEFLIEIILFGVGAGLITFGWFLVAYSHETTTEVVCGIALIGMAHVVLFVFVMIMVGAISL